jgi:hypothetical protein
MLFRFGDNILTCGGWSDAWNGWNRNCWRYDIPTDSWISYTIFNNNHHRYTNALVYNNKIYIVDSGSGETFNPATNSWSSGIFPMYNFGEGECMVQFNDTFAGFGGSTSNRFQIYNLTTATWSSPITLINGVYYGSCRLLPNSNGKVLVVGVDSCCSTGDQWATIINLVTFQQTSLPIPSLFRGWGVSLVTLGSRVFAVNGWNWNANIPVVEEFHLTNNSWTKIAAPLIQPRHRGKAINVPANWFSKLPNGCRGVL